MLRNEANGAMHDISSLVFGYKKYQKVFLIRKRYLIFLSTKLKYFLLLIKSSEYWYNQTITYLCKDPTLGLDKSARNRIDYRCLELYPAGNYSIPESSDLWPVCETRTATVKPGKAKLDKKFKLQSIVILTVW